MREYEYLRLRPDRARPPGGGGGDLQLNQRTNVLHHRKAFIIGQRFVTHQVGGNQGSRAAASPGTMHKHRAPLIDLFVDPVRPFAQIVIARNCGIEHRQPKIMNVMAIVECPVALSFGTHVEYGVDLMIDQELIVALVGRSAAQPQPGATQSNQRFPCTRSCR